MPDFNVEGARKAGYSDDEIARYLSQSRSFDLSGAQKAGYSTQEIIQHLSAQPVRVSGGGPMSLSPVSPPPPPTTTLPTELGGPPTGPQLPPGLPFKAVPLGQPSLSSWPGVQSIAHGVEALAGAVSPQEQARAQTLKGPPTEPAKNVASGLTQTLQGGLAASAPVVLPLGGFTAPLTSAAILGGGMLAGEGTTAGLKALGVAPEYSDFFGTLAGIAAGYGISWGMVPKGIRGIVEQSLSPNAPPVDEGTIGRLRAMASQSKSPMEAKIAREMLRKRYGVDIVEPEAPTTTATTTAPVPDPVVEAQAQAATAPKPQTPPPSVDPVEISTPPKRTPPATPPETKPPSAKPVPTVTTPQLPLNTSPLPVIPPPPDIPLQPREFLDKPETSEPVKAYGDMLWGQIPDVPKLADKFPLLDPEGLLTAVPKYAEKDQYLTDVLNLAHTAAKKMLALGKTVTSAPEIKDTAIALQASGTPDVHAVPSNTGQWMFTVNPGLVAGKPLGEAIWAQLLPQVTYALSDGKQELYQVNQAQVEKAVAPLKSAFVSRIDMAAEDANTTALTELSKTLANRRNYINTLSPYYRSIKFDLGPGDPRVVTRYHVAQRAQQDAMLYQTAPALPSGTKLFSVDNEPTAALLTNPKIKEFDEKLSPILQAISQVLDPSIAPLFDGLIVDVTPKQLIRPNASQFLSGKFVPTTTDLSRFGVALNPTSPTLLRAGETITSPDTATDKLLATIVHEFAHSAVLGHGPSHAEAIQQIMANFDPTPFLPIIRSFYADPANPSNFDPKLSDLHQQIAAGQPRESPATTQAAGVTGRPLKPGGKGARGSRAKPGLGTDVQRTSSEIADGTSDGYSGENEWDPNWGDWPRESDTLFTNDPTVTGPASVYDPTAIDTVPLDEWGRAMDIACARMQVPTKTHNDVVRYNRFYRAVLTTIQLAEMNPNIEPLQMHLQAARDYWGSKTEVTSRADEALREWSRLAKKHQKIVSEFTLEVAEASERRRRKLTQNELNAIATKVHATGDHIKLWQKIRDVLNFSLDSMEQALKDETTRLWHVNDPVLEQARHAAITKEYNLLRNRDYFPFTRFGRFIVSVTSTGPVSYQGHNYKAGRVIRFETHQWNWQSQNAAKDLRQQFAGQPVTVKTSTFEEGHEAFFGFPPALYKTLQQHLGLNKAALGTLKDIFFKRSPGAGFVKHLRRRRGTAGFSQDAMRGFADYMMHASNHLARLQTRYKFDAANRAMRQLRVAQPTDSTKLTEMHSWMNRHFKSLMDPKGDFGYLRGLGFTWFFAFVPKQVLVNATQVPMFTYPFLGKRFGDVATIRELTRAMRDCTDLFHGKNRLSIQEQALLSQGEKEGFLGESYASQVAAVAEGGLAGRYFARNDIDYKVRQAVDWGTYHFSMVEGYNRRVTFMATLRLGLAKGLTPEQAYAEARHAVDTCQFEYARWNRMEIMRDWKAVLLMFQTYKQHALYFSFSNQGGWRFWAMMLVMAGLMGLPMAETAIQGYNFAAPWMKRKFGSEDPYTDLESDAREFIKSYNMDPDYFLHGLARHTLGLTSLSWLGLPVPNLDMSSSLSLGQGIQGVEPTLKGLSGSLEAKEATLRAMTELLGASGTTGAQMAQGVFDQSVTGAKMLRMISPQMIKNIVDAYTLITDQAYTNSKGDKILPLDLHNPEHMAEVLAKVMGFAPTRLRALQEATGSVQSEILYYSVRREMVIAKYAQAANSDREDMADARDRVSKYNDQVPDEFKIKGRDLAQAVRQRTKNTELKMQGLPTQKRYYELHQRKFGAWPSMGQPESE